MPEQVLIDNDVAIKICSYLLVEEMLSAITLKDQPPAMLGVGKFVVRGRLERDAKVANKETALAALSRLLQVVSEIEPDDEELAFAAELEAEANRQGLELDGGESQLTAILRRRDCRLLITGDKRAIRALAAVTGGFADGRIACFEQLIGELIGIAGLHAVYNRVHREPDVDRAISICLASSREGTDVDTVLTGLRSYVDHLRRHTERLLAAGADLSALAH